MATSQTCCHLPGELLNTAAECADRARIVMLSLLALLKALGKRERKARMAECTKLTALTMGLFATLFISFSAHRYQTSITGVSTGKMFGNN
jgi:hypothetical protein